MTGAIVLAAILGAAWLLLVAWACVVTGGNRQPETPMDARREDGQP